MKSDECGNEAVVDWERFSNFYDNLYNTCSYCIVFKVDFLRGAFTGNGHAIVRGFSSPALLKSIKSCPNYKIQVNFSNEMLVSFFVEAISSDPDEAKGFRMINRLNKAGRNYMNSHPGNKAKGIGVLGDASDELDCLYFHLREYPLLFEPKKSDKLAAGDKRKTDGDDSGRRVIRARHA